MLKMQSFLLKFWTLSTIQRR